MVVGAGCCAALGAETLAAARAANDDIVIGFIE
jgi:hypothetical protein